MKPPRFQRVLSVVCLVLPLFDCPVWAERLEQSLSGAGWRLWRDVAAPYQMDALHLPPVDLRALPVHEPSGGWQSLFEAKGVMAVCVPGTAEEYLQKVSGPQGDITGVIWWYRHISVPVQADKKRVKLRFEAVRQRAEVFVNRVLVGYDLVGNTPFEVDITDVVRPGETAELAVRITDAGGNFDWRDGATYPWGGQQVLGSHGFGGITEGVTLVVCEPVHLDNVDVLNTPAVTEVKVLIDLANEGIMSVRRDLTLRIVEAANPSVEVARVVREGLQLQAGTTHSLEIPVSVPGARLWDLEHPNLYRCIARLESEGRTSDQLGRRFGFRWFGPEGIGRDATLRLNGKRIVLRTAISWGFWPVNGITPGPEWAERQVRVAKELGLNMLNFHRCIGQASVFDKADELGLLIYEEPGNWKGGDKAPFARSMAREKLLRMVRRDRSHPSLVLYNLINEDGAVKGEDLEARERDLRDAHAIDPSRVITRTSGWSKAGIQIEDTMKLHFRPYDAKLYSSGWYDFHHAGGPATWNQELYRGPREYYNFTENKEEIVFWGEEGALSTPPRLGLIKAELEKQPKLGWDGAAYLEYHKLFDDFLTRKNLRSAFPTVDTLTGALGNVSLDHQGRKIQLMRINNFTDGYAVNGWEAELIENHSGIVDCFRNPKGDPKLMARYASPVHVAVMPRVQIGQFGEKVKTDFFIVNERDLQGAMQLEVSCLDSAGECLYSGTYPVTLLGGDTFGHLLVEGVDVPVGLRSGYTQIKARLLDADKREVASGTDQVLCVDWKSERLEGRGAIFGQNPALVDFLRKEKGLDIPIYADQSDKLAWVVVARPPDSDQVSGIPEEQLKGVDEAHPGLVTSYYSDKAFSKKEVERVSKMAELNVADGATPDPAFPSTDGYHVRWEGRLVPTSSGVHTFAVAAQGGGVRLRVGETVLIDALGTRNRQATDRVSLKLEEGKPVSLVLEYAHMRGAGRCKLLWAVPESNPPDLERLLARVRDDGTRLILLDFADTWMPLLAKYSKIGYAGAFKVGTAWLGGVHFVKEHSLFKGLPSNDAMGWPYQALVANGNERLGLLMEGEELVAGAWHCNEEKSPMRLGTAVGVIRCGKGLVIFSTLGITENLKRDDGPSAVARKVLCNFVQYEGLPQGF